MTKSALKTNEDHGEQNAKAWLGSIEEMLAALNATDRTNLEGSREWDRKREDADQTIHESVLSVMVRDGWRMPDGATDEGPDEYEILLSTGGPALRIYGRLSDHGEPSSAELQHQDWGTPWTRYPAPEAILLAFAQRFYFGE